MSDDELIDAVLGNLKRHLENEEPIDLNLVKKVEYLSEFGSLWELVLEGIDAIGAKDLMAAYDALEDAGMVAGMYSYPSLQNKLYEFVRFLADFEYPNGEHGV